MSDFDLSLAIKADGSQAAGAIGEVKQELGGLGSAAGATVTPTNNAAKSTKDLERASASAAKTLRNQALAQRMVGVQINDFATQVSLGASPVQALSAQAGQLGFAMSQMGGKAEKVGNFLSGPWGAAVLIATAVLGPLVAKLFEGSDAADKLTDAQKLQKLSTEELGEAIKEEQKLLDKSIQSAADAERKAFDLANAKREETLRRRENIASILAEQIAQEKVLEAQTKRSRNSTVGSLAGREGGENLGAALGVVQGNIAGLEAQMAANQTLLAQASRAVLTAGAPILQRRSEERTDPLKGIAGTFDRELGKLNAQLTSGALSAKKYGEALDALRVKRRHDEEAVRESTKNPGAAKEKPVTSAEVQAFLRSEGISGITSGKRTPQHNRDIGGAANSYHLTDQAIDFTGIPGGLAGFDKAARQRLAARAAAVGIKLLENLGPGDRGHSDHGHIAFSTNRLSGDQRITEAAQQREAAERDAAKREADAKQLAAFGASASDKISGFGARFEEGSKAVIAAREQLEDLDRLLGEIQDRKPLNLERLLKDAAEARVAIQNSVQKPYRDFIEDQKFAAQQARLLATGREDEAEAIRTIRDLNKDNATLTADQEAAVRAIIAARRQEAREALIAQQRQQTYLDAVNETKDAVRAIFDGTGEGLRALPKRLMGAVEKVVGDGLFENLFGGFFRDLEDQAKGTTVVKDASQRMADAIAIANQGIGSLANAAQAAANKLAGIDPLAPLPDGAPAPAAGGVAGFAGDLGEVAVTGKRAATSRGSGPTSPAAFFGGAVEKLARKVGIGAPQAKRDEQVAKALKDGVQIKPDVASKLGAAAGKGMAGFATGSIVDGFAKPIGKALGIRTSRLGAQLGGAAGAFLPIPFGKEIGAVVGSVIGGLFKGKKVVPNGSSTITSVNGDAGYTGSKEYKGAVTGAAKSIQDALSGIADQLGGGLGNFAVSIGQRHGDFRVDTSGAGKTKIASGAIDFNEDEAGAIAYAVADAIKDGAITGLSEAVTKALGSSSDVDRALREALKVQDLEFMLKGTGAEFEKAFRQFEVAAADRTRLAKKYGFDLVKLEEITGKQRADVLEAVVRDRVGALQDLIKDLDFGNLFEGTLADQRQAILGQIQTTQAEVQKGTDGATTTLANLQRQLLSVSREAYGTAGPEYGGDLAETRRAAEAAIALETARAKEAQDRAIASLAASTQQVALVNETNNILAEHTALLRSIAGSMGGTDEPAVYAPQRDLTTTLRTVSLL